MFSGERASQAILFNLAYKNKLFVTVCFNLKHTLIKI